MKKEIWKDIPGYEGLYQVSNWGQVKSLNYNHSGKERLLKQSISSGGHYHLSLSKNGIVKDFGVHQLVAMTFLGHIPNGYETVVNHIDNNPKNNYVDNLELTTQAINSRTHKTDPGVCWFTRDNKWNSKIRIKDKRIHLGNFIDKQDAIDMYQKAVANTHLYNGDNKAFRLALANVAL